MDPWIAKEIRDLLSLKSSNSLNIIKLVKEKDKYSKIGKCDLINFIETKTISTSDKITMKAYIDTDREYPVTITFIPMVWLEKTNGSDYRELSISLKVRPENHQVFVHEKLNELNLINITTFIDSWICCHKYHPTIDNLMKPLEPHAKYTRVIVTEFPLYGNFKQWINDHFKSPNLSKISKVRKEFKSILVQIIGTLSKIRTVHSNFRHHNLHLENILLTGTNSSRCLILKEYSIPTYGKIKKFAMPENIIAMLSDFSMASFNDCRNTVFKTLYPKLIKTTPYYDIFTLFNSLYQENLGGEYKNFLERYLPPKFRIPRGYPTNGILGIEDNRLTLPSEYYPELQVFIQTDINYILDDQFFDELCYDIIPL
jgi:hypothetical protein